MTALPGAVLWLFLIVNYTIGQITDISNFKNLDVNLDEIERSRNTSKLQFNNEEKEKKILQPEEKKEKPEKEEKNTKTFSDLLINKIAILKPTIALEKSQDTNELNSKESVNGRGKRRRITYSTMNPSNVVEIPEMSPGRKNSYLSIAERRRYYNRTQTRKPENFEMELKNQDTNNKTVSPTMETLQTNEIRIGRKEMIKDIGVVVLNKKNQINNQRVLGSAEKQLRPLSSRQSVIQSQFQFGQKINLKKPGLPNLGDQRSARKSENFMSGLNLENSTNKFYKNDPTLSTKLLRVDKKLWTTTLLPQANVEAENYVMKPNQNITDLRKVTEEYFAVNKTEAENILNSTNASYFFYNNRLPENKFLRSQAIKLMPLPLNFENSTKNRSETSSKEGIKIIANNLKYVNNQEIFRVTSTTRVPLKNLDYLNKNLTSSWENDNLKTKNSEQKTILNLTPTTEVFSETTPMSFSSSMRSALPQNSMVYNYVSASTTQVDLSTFNRTSELLENDKKVIYNSSKGTIPFIRVIPKEEMAQSEEILKTKTLQNESIAPLAEVQKDEKIFSIFSPPLLSWSSTEEYPLTIELNENNKRVLSEMFHTSTIADSKRTEPMTTSHAKLSDKTNNDELSSIAKQSATSTTTLSYAKSDDDGSQINLPVEPPNEIDHKPMGTRFNTRFYISPNVSRNQVIKVIDNEDEDEDYNDVALLTRPVGVAIYVLAAFGIIPLLLAAMFVTRFIMQKRQRECEYESDVKSDGSTNDCPPRPGRKKKRVSDLKKSPSNATTTTLVATTRLPRFQHWEDCEKQGNKNWEYPRSKLKLKTILGQGNFGQVWKAEAEDIAGHEGRNCTVAVKSVKEGATDKQHTEFIKELEIMQQIGSHPNIVTLLGCCTDQEPHYLIMEYVKHGKLLTYLREHRINENYYNFSNNSDALTSRDLTVFAFCIARGMEYLASRGIIHRDLAARNVLVDHNKVCKIADFGMSRSVRNSEDGQVYEERQHKGALPIRWMAPESLVYSVFTFKSDVWSFGIVMWEIVTLGSTPYPNMGAREVMRRVRDGYRLERPNHCNPEFYRLISHCWSHDPSARPDFSELRGELSNLLDNPAKEGSYVDLDQFAVTNSFHVTSKSNDLRLLERGKFAVLKRFGDWDAEDCPIEAKKSRGKKSRNIGMGTVTLTGHGSFTVNSRILEKEFLK